MSSNDPNTLYSLKILFIIRSYMGFSNASTYLLSPSYPSPIIVAPFLPHNVRNILNSSRILSSAEPLAASSAWIGIIGSLPVVSYKVKTNTDLIILSLFSIIYFFMSNVYGLVMIGYSRTPCHIPVESNFIYSFAERASTQRRNSHLREPEKPIHFRK